MKTFEHVTLKAAQEHYTNLILANCEAVLAGLTVIYWFND